jgi:hypothetical protein
MNCRSILAPLARVDHAHMSPIGDKSPIYTAYVK